MTPEKLQHLGPLTPGAGEACERVLLKANNVVVAHDNAAWFEIATPDVQCVTLVRVGIRCPQESSLDPRFQGSVGSGPAPYAWPARLMMVACELERGPAAPAPSRAFAGSAASPLQIPTSPDLWAYEQEVETAGGPLFGALVVGGDPAATTRIDDASNTAGTKSQPPAGFHWVVSVRYQSRVPMTDEQWRNVCEGAGISLIKGGGFLK